MSFMRSVSARESLKVIDYVGSSWTTAMLTLVLAGVYLAMSFGGNPYGPFMDFLMRSPVGAGIYLLLGLNLTVMSVYAVMRRREPVCATAQDIRAMDAYAHLSGDSGLNDLDGVGQWLAGMGFMARPSGEGIAARRGVGSIVPGMVLRAGLVLVMLGAIMSTHMRKAEEILVTEGWAGNLLGRELSVSLINAGLPDEFLSVGNAGLEDVEATAVVMAGERDFKVTGRYPSGVAGLYLRVTHLGYAQPVASGQARETMFLDLLPPGMASVHSMPGGAEVYEFRLVPDRTIKKGLLSGDMYDLKVPRYSLRARGGKGGDIIVESGGSVSVDGRVMSFGPVRPYLMLKVVKDPALPLLRAGFFIVALGLVLMFVRLFWYERRFAVVMHEGRVLVGYSEEFYKKWGIYKFRGWMERV